MTGLLGSLQQNTVLTAEIDWSSQGEMLGQATSWLDGIYHQITHGAEAQAALSTLHSGLFHLRRQASRKDWRKFCLEVARNHPLRELLHQCPFTRHGYERPRGYAGDAELLDYLYAEREKEGLHLHPGIHIYRFMYHQPSPRSARERLRLLAREIDLVAAQVPMPRILSVACGHLREAAQSHAVKEHRIGELIAFDQDPVSLAEVTRQHPETAIRPVCGSVRSILTGRTMFGHMDLVYSAGLYDYVLDKTARRLTQLLFSMLNPGGRLLIANFATCPEAGYFEAFMDWWLIYRDEADMQTLTQEIDPRQLASTRMFRDSEQNVIYLELTRS
jgi:extracellular factor (EF) 3-hydroxypalmitic acid methyl ester biosynthesis protein